RGAECRDDERVDRRACRRYVLLRGQGIHERRPRERALGRRLEDDPLTISGIIRLMDEPLIHGACLCGAVRFDVTPPTKWCAHCRGTMGGRAHGAGVVTWFGAHSSSVRIVAGDEALRWYRSSAGARRGFCGTCGSMLFFEGDRWPGETHIARA